MKKYTILGDLITPAKVVRCGKGNYPVLSMTMQMALFYKVTVSRKVLPQQIKATTKS